MGRRARVRRHGDADPAAHRAALRRTLGARSRQHARRPVGRSQLDIVKDYWTRAFAGQGWTLPRRRGQAVRQRRSVLEARAPRRFHPRHVDRRRRTRHAVRAGAQAPGSAAAARRLRAAAPQPGAARRRSPQPQPARLRQQPRHRRTAMRSPHRRIAGAGGGPRDHLQAGSDRLGRPLRQQRLAAGAAQAADEGHLGRHGLGAPVAGRSARPARRRRHRAALPRQHRADADLPRRRPPAPVGHGVLRLRPAHGRPRRQRAKASPSSSTRSCSARRTRRGSAPVWKSRRPATGTCWRPRRNTT